MREKPISVVQAAKLALVTPQAIRLRVRKGSLPDRRQPGARKLILFRSDIIKPESQLP